MRKEDAVHVSVVLGSYNRKDLLQRAIASIRDSRTRYSFETIVVDGGSNDGSIEWLIGQKDVLTIVQHNRGEVGGRPVRRRSWGYFMNLSFKAAQGKYILMISDDCLLHPGTMDSGVEGFETLLAQGRKVGAMAFYYRDWPSAKEYCVQLTLGGKLFVNHGLYLRSALGSVGWADEERYLFYKADGDVCLRLWQAGYEVVDCPAAYVEHYLDPEEEVRNSNQGHVLEHDRKAYLDRWKGIYYFPHRRDARKKIFRSYADQHETVARYWRDLPARNTSLEGTGIQAL